MHNVNKKQLLQDEILPNLVDRQWLSVLNELPDPDPILRKAGIDHEIYNEILGDPHVMGEVRKLYASLLGYKYEVRAGDDSANSAMARDLCQNLFDMPPNNTMRWPDLFWSIGKSPLTGRRAHHVSWSKSGSYILPSSIVDIPQRSYTYNVAGDLLIRTVQNPTGEVADSYRWLVTRHMPDSQNPFGVAILSSCFWPWMFKNGGIKFFTKFCEKFGVPWPIAKYPKGTTDDDIDELVARLQSMVEDAVGALPEDSTIDLISVSATGELPQERLVNLMNREMSKALTSQTTATELNGQGSRAQAQVGDARTSQNNRADRALVADTMNELFHWITLVNFGPNTKPPLFVYLDKQELNTKDVEFFEKAVAIVPVKTSDIYKRLGLSQPKDGEDVVFNPDAKPNSMSPEDDSAEFSSSSEYAWNQADQAISDIIDQIKAAIDQGQSMDDALAAIIDVMPAIDRNVLEAVISQELEIDFGIGMLESNEGQ